MGGCSANDPARRLECRDAQFRLAVRCLLKDELVLNGAHADLAVRQHGLADDHHQERPHHHGDTKQGDQTGARRSRRLATCLSRPVGTTRSGGRDRTGEYAGRDVPVRLTGAVAVAVAGGGGISRTSRCARWLEAGHSRLDGSRPPRPQRLCGRHGRPAHDAPPLRTRRAGLGGMCSPPTPPSP